MVRNFKSKGGYNKWVAFGHMHGLMSGKKHHYDLVKIKGITHHVKHNRK